MWVQAARGRQRRRAAGPPCAGRRRRRRPRRRCAAFHGSETRIAWPASGPRPIAASTWLAVTLPELHAAPALTAIPSRSSAITCASARTPGSARQVVLASRGAPAPQTTAPFRQGRSLESRRAAAARCAVSARDRRGGSETGDRGQRRACRRDGRAPGRRRRSAARSMRRPGPAARRRRPCGPPSLCDEIARLCAPSVGQTRHPSARRPAPHRRAAARRAAGRERRPRDRLDRAGLVVRQHQADQRRRLVRQRARPMQQDRRRRCCPPAGCAAPGAAERTASCSVAPTIDPTPGAKRVDRQRVRLGAA